MSQVHTLYTMRSFNSSSSSRRNRTCPLPSNWMGWKELGKRAYDAGDYEEALQCYKTAVQAEYECPNGMEKQVLLSNMVACRLKLVANSSTSSHESSSDSTAAAGAAATFAAATAQAAAAVENAKQCIAINPSWSKGHVRLASAYIALGQATTAATANSGGSGSGSGSGSNNTTRMSYSNDACNALQTALRLDPGNAVARQMLLRELRGRDHHHNQQHTHAATPAPPPPPQNPNYRPSSSSSESVSQQTRGDDGGGGANNNNNNRNSNNNNRNESSARAPFVDDVDETADDDLNSMSWRERIQYHQARLVHWYQNQTDIKKSCIKGIVLFLVLYVAFGGRFGLLESSSSSSSTSSSRRQRQYSHDDQHASAATTTETAATRGNYGSGNAYDEYRRRRRAQGGGGNQYYNNEYEYDYYGDMHRQRQRQQQQQYGHGGGGGNSYYSSWSSSFSLFNLFDGSLPSMAILLGIAYLCHRNGINPFQVIMMMNIMTGRRHGRGGGMYYGGGMGGMRYGGGGGGRRRYW
jgi:tetratricopeptide (TPR) repeat protein